MRSSQRVARAEAQPTVCDDVKLVLITNASMFHRPVVERGLEILDRTTAKSGPSSKPGRTSITSWSSGRRFRSGRCSTISPPRRSSRPLVIQSLFMRIHGEPPSEAEIDAFIDRLNEIQQAGGKLKLVQVYTVARPPAESFVTPLSNEEVDQIAHRVESETGIPTKPFYA